MPKPNPTQTPLNQIHKRFFMNPTYMKALILILVTWVLCSCGDKPKDAIQTSNKTASSEGHTKMDTPTNLLVEGDTINLVGKHVLFFGPSEDIIKERKIDRNALQLFNQVAQSLIDSIGTITAQAKASMTTVGNVRIYGNSESAPKMIILSTFSESFGMVISDGTNLTPITKGVRTREEYESQIRKTLNFENR